MNIHRPSVVANHYYRVKDLQALGAAEIKLLYTLHWILLFASAECADEEAEARKLAEQHPYLFSIPTISVCDGRPPPLTS